MKDYMGRRISKGAAMKARNHLQRARDAKERAAYWKAQPGSEGIAQDVAQIHQRRCEREVRYARGQWRIFLHWRRVYRADEAGDMALMERLLAVPVAI